MQTILLFAILVTAQAGEIDLTGKVVDSTGRPIENSRVFVYTAGPREGTSPLCPSCYADCTKETTANSTGGFTIKSLDPKLIFRILAVAEGYRPRIISQVDPAKGPMRVELQKTPTGLRPRQMIRGRIVNERGQPIVGAVVEPYGTKTESRRWWGRMPGVDAVSVTNEAGEFLITTKEPKLGFDFHVSARGYATRKTPLLRTGNDAHTISMTVGASVSGRLMKEGRPLPGIVMGLVQLDRSSDEFIGEYQIGTNKNGNFLFVNVHPNDKYVLYTKMTSIEKQGALKTVRIEVAGDDTTTRAGTLNLGPASTIAGRVMLTDGKPLPDKTRLMLSREEAWDYRTLNLKADGEFSIGGIPREPLKLILRIPGYRLASRRNRFQQIGTSSLALFVDGDRKDLKIYLEPIPK